jgi:hypothetical protein
MPNEYMREVTSSAGPILFRTTQYPDFLSFAVDLEAGAALTGAPVLAATDADAWAFKGFCVGLPLAVTILHA